MKSSIILILFILLISCNSSIHDTPKNITQFDIERVSPLKYLKLTSKYRINVFKDIKIEGRIANYASVANYKDVTLQVFCINKAGQVIKREKKTVLDLIVPNLSLPFEIATKAADSTDTVMIKLFDATGVK